MIDKEQIGKRVFVERCKITYSRRNNPFFVLKSGEKVIFCLIFNIL